MATGRADDGHHQILLLLKEGSTLSDIQQMYPHEEIGTFERVLEELATSITSQPQHYAP